MLIDSTNDVLWHELIETITDPDGRSWWDSTSGGMFGEEIGDECVFVTFVGGIPYSDPAIISVDGRRYALQPEYDNRAQACTARNNSRKLLPGGRHPRPWKFQVRVRWRDIWPKPPSD
jgi:hypothetical protein